MATYPQPAKPPIVKKTVMHMTKMSLSVLAALGGFALASGQLNWVATAQAQTASSSSQNSRIRWQPKAEQGQARGTLSGGRRGGNAGDATARWKPKPQQGNIQGTLSGGRRGPEHAACSNEPDATRLNLLVPSGHTSLLSQQVQPTLMWHVATQDATQVDFVLSDVTQPDPLYVSTQVVESDSLMQATLPETVTLEEGQRYRWAVMLQCPEGEAVEIYARSFIQLADGEPLVQGSVSSNSASLQSQADLELAIAAAEEGIWYDALAYAYRAQISDPSNGEAASAFETLLESVQ